MNEPPLSGRTDARTAPKEGGKQPHAHRAPRNRHPNHRYLATRAFSADERRRIREAAQQLVVNLRPRLPDGTPEPGFRAIPDPHFAYRVVRLADLTACHISVLARLRSQNVYRDRIGRWEGVVIGWRRPKNEELVKVPIFPADEDMLPWLPGFLDQPRPQEAGAYDRLFRRISDRLTELGTPIHVNALRFRHTKIIEWQQLGLSNPEVAHMAGCTPGVVAKHYLAVDQDQAIDRLAQLVGAIPTPPSPEMP